MKDFQLSDDFFVFLPYAAIGFGAFLNLAVRRADNPRLVAGFLGAIFLGITVSNTFDTVSAEPAYRLKGTEIRLAQQREGAAEVEEELGKDAKLISINSPQLLVLLHQKNPNPYIFITAGIDREIAAEWPGGFEGWIRDLEAYDPDGITFLSDGQTLQPGTHLTSEHYKELNNCLGSRYQTEKIGPWWLFVKKGLSRSDQRASLDPQQETRTTAARVNRAAGASYARL